MDVADGLTSSRHRLSVLRSSLPIPIHKNGLPPAVSAHHGPLAATLEQEAPPRGHPNIPGQDRVRPRRSRAVCPIQIDSPLPGPTPPTILQARLDRRRERPLVACPASGSLSAFSKPIGSVACSVPCHSFQVVVSSHPLVN